MRWIILICIALSSVDGFLSPAVNRLCNWRPFTADRTVQSSRHHLGKKVDSRHHILGTLGAIVGDIEDQHLNRIGPQFLHLANISTTRCTQSDVPECYWTVLGLLRALNNSGRWPSTSRRRREVLRPNNGHVGDSFTIGLFPPPLRLPHANSYLSDLLVALHQLESVIAPARPRSTTITVNRNAQFWPHRDSGAGAGQSTSFIVGLGDYSGGELMVDGSPHSIRYRPLEFDGWAQEHWTLPFEGERYSLVWYIPKGLEEAAKALQAGCGWDEVQNMVAAQAPMKPKRSLRRSAIDEIPLGPITTQLFSMVPPTANLKGKPARFAIAELATINATNILLPESDLTKSPSFQGRVLFDTNSSPASFVGLKACDSIRAILMHEDFTRTLGSNTSTKQISAWIMERSDWAMLDRVWIARGNEKPLHSGLRVHVRCRRSSGRLGDGLVQVHSTNSSKMDP